MSDLGIKERISGLFAFRPTRSHLIISLTILSIALLQTTSIWNYTGDKVDELAIYSHAVGFLGGDLNPHWFDYGSFGMYLNFLVYIILYVPLYMLGQFDSIEEYAMQLFHNGYFVLVARYVFAVLGVAAVFIYAKIAKQFKIPGFLIVSFILLSILSVDAIHFANRLRTDILIGFFSALAIYCAVHSKNKKYLYFLAIAIAGAICSKISSLPLVGLLFIYIAYRLYDKTIVWKDFIFIVLTLILFVFLFQPYMNWFERIENLIRLVFESGGSGEGHINWRINYMTSYTERAYAIGRVFIDYCSLPVLLTLPLVVFTKKYKVIIIPSIIVLLLLTTPYLISKEIVRYWFAPAFMLVRFISLLSIAGFYYTIKEYCISKRISHRFLKSGSITIFVLLSSIFVLTPNLRHYFKQIDRESTNRSYAQKWVEQNILGNSNILLERTVSHLLPILFDPGDIKMSKSMSIALFYGGGKNEFLNNLFEDFLENHYCQNIGIDSVYNLISIKSKNNNASLINKDYRGYYYITSRGSYGRILKRKSQDLSERRKNELEGLVAYHQFMISNPRIIKFSDGIKSAVEIFKINKVFDIKKDELGYLFYDEYGEVHLKNKNILNGDITIDLLIRINSYPEAWTSIISKHESDVANEFNLRMKNKELGQWYYGTGTDATVMNFLPSRFFPLGRWVRVTTIRSISSGKQVIYVNKELFKEIKFKKMMPAALTSAPLSLFGNSKRTLHAQIQYLKIWDQAINPEEIDKMNISSKNNSESENLIGYWKFENVKGEIVNDLSGNGNDLVLKKL